MLIEQFKKVFSLRARPSLFYTAMLLPLIFSTFYSIWQSHKVSQLEDFFYQSLQGGKASLKRKAIEESFFNRYNHADPYFLDHKIETLRLLEKERQTIQTLINHPATAQKKQLLERLAFLSGKENTLSFTEQNPRSSHLIKETEEKQHHLVEVDEEDLKTLLALIEDRPIETHLPEENPPQLLIEQFHLQRTVSPIGTEVFLLDMSLLKREFSQ
jgi:hypothetical protein